MSKGIPISQEFGLNPTVPVCFYCGEDKNEIVMFGANLKQKNPHTGRMETIEAPRRMVMNLEPCDKCKEKYEDFVLICEADGSADQKPTGRWIAIRKEALNVENPAPVAMMYMNEFRDLLKRCEGLEDE